MSQNLRNQRWLDRLERRFGRYAVANVTGALVLGQILLYVISRSQPDVLTNIVLVPDLVLRGLSISPWALFGKVGS